MTGTEYANAVAAYIVRRFGYRGVEVYREVSLGKSIIGKNRRVDILVVVPSSQRAVAIECKYQGSQGTVDEKIPYALQDMVAMPMPGLIVYAGDGFSPGVVHLLEASEVSAWCLPVNGQSHSDTATRELDHQLAMRFGWWDILTEGKPAFQPPPQRT
jgi:hypothetical protein